MPNQKRTMGPEQMSNLYTVRGYSYQKIATIAGVSRQRVSQLVHKCTDQKCIDRRRTLNRTANYMKREKYGQENANKLNRFRLIRYLKTLEKAGLIWHWNYLACRECGANSKKSRRPGGFCPTCRSRLLYQTSPKRRAQTAEYNKNWRENNVDGAREINRRAGRTYYKKNSEKILARQRTRRNNN